MTLEQFRNITESMSPDTKIEVNLEEVLSVEFIFPRSAESDTPASTIVLRTY